MRDSNHNKVEVLLMLALLFGVMACGNSQSTPASQNKPSPTPSATNTSTPAPTAAITKTTAPTVTTTQTSTPASRTTPTFGDKSNLSHALEFMPQASIGFILDFTDWRLIKEDTGHLNLTSKSSLEQRKAFIESFKNQASTSRGQIYFYLDAKGQTLNYQLERWDGFDLDWDASMLDISILKFCDDFDFAALMKSYEEKQFTKTEYRGVSLYSDGRLHNRAMLSDKKIMIDSLGSSRVKEVLDAYQRERQSAADNKAAQMVVNQLGKVASATIASVASGTDICHGMYVDFNKLKQESFYNQLLTLKEPYSKVHTYNVLGVGYRNEGNSPVGLIVMNYKNESDAQADLPLRSLLAKEGVSWKLKQSYSDSSFTFDNALAAGDNLVLQVKPLDNMPSKLLGLFLLTDMLFAACPS